MNAHTASLINALTLIAMGAWGYFGTSAPTALIPVFIGVILMVLNNGIRYDNKVIAHIAVVLTLLILVSLIKPLTGKINSGDNLGILRVGLMLITSVFAMIMFVRSFIAAKKARKNL